MTSEEPDVDLQQIEHSAGRLVIRYLQDSKDGATATEIMHHLRKELKNASDNLDKVVESILDNGTALGFLERKGSHYMNWMARHPSRRKRKLRSSSSRRRRRPIRRRRSHCVRCCRRRCRLLNQT